MTIKTASGQQPRALSVSQTTLNLLRDCQRCFWLYLKVGLKHPRGPWPSVHTKLDRDTNNYFNRYARQGLVPPLLQGRLEGTPVFPDLPAWYDAVSGLYLAGRLDACVRLESGLYAPVDHKTGGSLPKEIHPAYQLQLDAYHLLLERNGYSAAGVGFLIYYVPDGCQMDAGLSVEVGVERVDTDEGRALARMAKAREVLDLRKPPEPSIACEFCTWARLAG